MPRPRIARPPLLKRTIDAATASDKDIFLWDGTEHGLGVKITPAGSKIFILQKTIRHRLRRITLGAYGDMTLDAARKRAAALNGQIASGQDPIAEARQELEAAERQAKSELSMVDLWARYSLEVVAANKPRTAGEKTRMWRRRIEPALGKLKVRDITEAEAGDVVRAPLKMKDDRIVGGRAEAGNLYRLLHHIFRKALLWRLRPLALGNPLDGVEAPKVPRRTRLLTTNETGALISELDRSLDSGDEAAIVMAAIRVVILTGARVSEILNLTWAEVRSDELELHLTDTKSDFSRRPISREALAVIESVKRMPGVPYVFRSPTDPEIPLSYNTVEKAFRRIRDRAGVEKCTLHTVRHWFSTATANSVNNPRVGMTLTGHRSLTAYMNYVHGNRDQARELADQIGAFTSGLAGGKNVVPIRSRKGG